MIHAYLPTTLSWNDDREQLQTGFNEGRLQMIRTNTRVQMLLTKEYELIIFFSVRERAVFSHPARSQRVVSDA